MRLSLRNTAMPVLISVVALLVATVVHPPPVEAHAVLVRSFPASQSQLLDPPSVLDLWFSEPLEAGSSTFELFASDGSPQPIDNARVDPADQQHLSGLLRRLDPGVYTVVYRGAVPLLDQAASCSYSHGIVRAPLRTISRLPGRRAPMPSRRSPRLGRLR